MVEAPAGCSDGDDDRMADSRRCAHGPVGDATSAVLALATPISAPCSVVLGVGGPDDACVRVVHASPDAGNVDITLPDGTELATDVSTT